MSQSNHIDTLAKKLWGFGQMHHKLEPSDAIIVFGSYDTTVADWAAKLFKEGWAPVVVFSGNRSESTSDWPKTEAETMADIAISLGVPKDKIFTETEARNTGENIIFSKALLAKHDIHPQRIIGIQKPYAERRAFATIKKRWPEVEVIMSSPAVTYEEYISRSPKGRDGSITTMVGDLQRTKIYPAEGWTIEQEIPDDVWEAYEKLIDLGYDKRLYRSKSA